MDLPNTDHNLGSSSVLQNEDIIVSKPDKIHRGICYDSLSYQINDHNQEAIAYTRLRPVMTAQNLARYQNGAMKDSALK